MIPYATNLRRAVDVLQIAAGKTELAASRLNITAFLSTLLI